MIFVLLYWVSAVALMVGWPWNKDGKWSNDLPLVATCAKQEPCGVTYGRLAEARQQGQVLSLSVKEPIGEIKEEDNWLKWETVSGQAWQFEVKRSSRYFETRTRYRLEGDSPVLVQSRDVGAQALIFALPISAFFLLGIRLRSLRK